MSKIVQFPGTLARLQEERPSPEEETAFSVLQQVLRWMDSSAVYTWSVRELCPGLEEVNQGEEIIVLKWSYRFNLDDLSIDEEGLRATLSFPGIGDRFVDVPWGAVVQVSLA